MWQRKLLLVLLSVWFLMTTLEPARVGFLGPGRIILGAFGVVFLVGIISQPEDRY